MSIINRCAGRWALVLGLVVGSGTTAWGQVDSSTTSEAMAEDEAASEATEASESTDASESVDASESTEASESSDDGEETEETLSAGEDEASEAAEEPSGVETIVVTSQKRKENIQDIPVAVTVLTSDDINQSYSNTIENLQMLVPTLTFRKGTTTRNSALTLRGVGTISFSIAAEPSVATIVDGVVMARSGQAFTDLYDLEQIEVLRGPQGTLFGKNSSAGAINMTTKGGSDTFEARLSATAFEGEEYRFKGSVAGPITDDMKGRVTGFFGTFAGNITNLFDGSQINGYNRYGSRGILEYNPVAGVRLKLIGDYYKGNDDCCAEITGVSTNGDGDIDRDGIRGVALDGIDTRTVNHNLVTRTIDETYGVSLTADIDAGDHTVTAILAYRNWDNTEIREGDFLPAAYDGVFELHDTGIQTFQQFSGELRLTSPQGQFLEYIGGLFAWRSTSDRSFTREDIVCSDVAPGVPNEFGTQPCYPGLATLTFPTSTAQMTSNFTNLGLFGQAKANVTDDFRVVAGARYIYDRVGFTHNRPAALVGGPGVRDVANDLEDSTDDHNFAVKLALQYDLFDNVMAYGSYARGYKGPAYNVFYNMGRNNRLPVSEETSNAFELGVKSTLFDNLMNLNVTGYFARYNDFQANNFVVIDGATTTTLTNAGNVQTLGAEIDLIAFPTSWLTLIGGLAYTDATIVEFNTNPDDDPADANDRNGDPLPLAPKLKLSLAAEINVPFSVGLLELNAQLRSQFAYTSEQFSDIGNATTGTRWPIDAYSLWHASFGFSDRGNQNRLTFIVRNILDQSFVTLNTSAGARLHIPRDADRYFGVNFTTQFY